MIRIRGNGVLLSRRQCVHGMVRSLVVIPAISVRRGTASQVAPATPAAAGFTLRFPEGVPLPAGLTLQASGTRQTLGEITGTFRNARDATQLLASWGWQGNVYRSYAAEAGAGAATPARLEISLHRFRASTGAAYAVSYFAHDRAVATRQQEEPIGLLLPCAATVLENGTATRYLRRRNLLVRVTVVMPQPADASADAAALATATSLAMAVLAHAGSAAQAEHVFC